MKGRMELLALLKDYYYHYYFNVVPLLEILDVHLYILHLFKDNLKLLRIYNQEA